MKDEKVKSSFPLRLRRSIKKCGSPLCVGLDPNWEKIHKIYGANKDLSNQEKARIVSEFCGQVLDSCKDRVPVIKPQIAYFEQYGHFGIAALEEIVLKARSMGFLVILDAKRGDIGETSDAYASSYFAEGCACEVDAITIAPYMGRDSYSSFLPYLARGKALFVLLKTSNESASEIQDIQTDEGPLYVKIAKTLAEDAEQYICRETGLSSLGVVVGANRQGDAAIIRRYLPGSIHLMPGVGAQGAGFSYVVKGLRSEEGEYRGGIVNSSRDIIFPNGSYDGSPNGWRQALESRLGEYLSSIT